MPPTPQAKITGLDLCRTPVWVMENNALDIQSLQPPTKAIKRSRNTIERPCQTPTMTYKQMLVHLLGIALHLRADQLICAIG